MVLTIDSFRLKLAQWVAGRTSLSVSAQVNDAAAGWAALTGRPHDRDAADMQRLYLDTLEAWRKNPIARRIVDVVTDYTLGDGLEPAAPGEIGRFIQSWWHHPQNNMPLRLPELVDELTRAGDIFPTLHTNPADGMSYVRLIPKDSIVEIQTAGNDWETEVGYVTAGVGQDKETRGQGDRERGIPLVSPALPQSPGLLVSRFWPSPHHPKSANAPAVMLHYAVNRPVGALFGESDLATMVPWLLRYSRMLEDRVRLHWALRAFLWVVTVPGHQVTAKRAQYAAAPEAGSIIVKDDAERWEVHAPALHGADAGHDLHAVRMMIDAGSAVPPHWRGEGTDLNLATAKAMQDPAIRHLRRRQLYLQHVMIDLAHQAYSRAYALGKVRARPNRAAITVKLPDMSREDNLQLAQAARELATTLETARQALPGRSDTFTELMLSLILRFAGEPQSEGVVARVLSEAKSEERN